MGAALRSSKVPVVSMNSSVSNFPGPGLRRGLGLRGLGFRGPAALVEQYLVELAI